MRTAAKSPFEAVSAIVPKATPFANPQNKHTVDCELGEPNRLSLKNLRRLDQITRGEGPPMTYAVSAVSAPAAKLNRARSVPDAFIRRQSISLNPLSQRAQSTDSLPSPSECEAQDLAELGLAGPNGNWRDRTRGQMEMYKRTMAADNQGDPRTESAPGGLGDQGSVFVRTDATRQNSPIEIVIHNTHVRQDTRSDSTATAPQELGTRYWPGGPLIDCSSPSAALLTGAIKISLAAAVTAAGVYITYRVGANGAGIAANRGLITMPPAMPPPPPTRLF